MNFSRRKWLASVFVFATAIVAVGQNCTAPRSASGGSQQASIIAPSAHGGDGYDGKLFLNRLLNTVCPDGSDVKSAIVVQSARVAYVTRENCAPVNNRPLTNRDFSFMPHNINNLIFTDRAFDLEPKLSQDPRATTYLCRGSETAAYYLLFHGITMPADFRDRYVDMIVKPAANGSGHTARLIVGLYEQGSVETLSRAPHDSGEFPAVMDIPSVGPRTITGTDASGGSLSLLAWLEADGRLTGKALYQRDPNLPPAGPDDMPDFNFYMTCYPQ